MNSFTLANNLLWVDASIVGPAGLANVRLILDTGAALTTLVPSIAEAIGYDVTMSIRPTVMRTAVAEERGYLVDLFEISTLGVTMPALQVNVADLGYGVEGLLGMNFLLEFNIAIRPAERRIRIEKIASLR